MDGAIEHLVGNGRHPTSTENYDPDLEQKAMDDAHLMNKEVKTFAWTHIKVVVKDHKTKKPKAILDGVDGVIEAGGNFCRKSWTIIH